MQKDTLISGIDVLAEDNGSTVIGGSKLCFRDAALLSYYALRTGRMDEALRIIKSLSNEKKSERQFTETALWVWMVGEYTNKTKDRRLIDEYGPFIGSCIEFLGCEWKNARENWLGILGEDVYVSTLAITFGAMQSISNSVDSETARKSIRDLKVFLYKNFLVEGKVVSALSNREVMGDIGIIAVPFGIMDAGNQILVESMKTLEEKQSRDGISFSAQDECKDIRNVLSCLLSWYYSERGDKAIAKQLLTQADNERAGTALECILYLIAQLNIAEKEKHEGARGNGVEIIHSPEGTGNRYITEPFQRIPVYPLENESVAVRMLTQPMSAAQTAYVECSVDGNINKINMKLRTSGEGENYWEAEIGGFSFGERVEYRFIVEDGAEKAVSEQYGFTVRKWAPAGRVADIKREDGRVYLYFQSDKKDKRPVLCLTDRGEGSLQISLSIEECKPYETKDALSSVDFGRAKITMGSTGVEFTADRLRSYKKRPLLELLADGTGTIYKARYNFMIDPGEKFFGMGERYSRIEYSGLDIDNYIYNQYTNQKLRTYIPVPFTISSRGYGIFADTAMYSLFRFGTKKEDLLEIEADISSRTQSLSVYVFTGTPKEMLNKYSNVTGKPELPPKWAFGPWMSSNNWDSQAETLKQAELNQSYAVPATVLVLEQWSDEATFYIFNDAVYKLKNGGSSFEYNDFTFPEWGRWPDPKRMIEILHEMGMKVLLWQVAAMKHMDGIAHAQRDEDEAFMIEKGYCVKLSNGTPYRIPSYEWFKRSLVPDFTNPDARNWWLGKRLYLLKELKIDGFKTDGGECVFGEGPVFYDGRAGAEMRNIYPNEYIRSFHDFAKKHCNDGAVTFSRAGYTGAQTIPLHWAGDESSTFEALRASLNAGLSCGMSGIPFWGWDIAGFHGGIPTAELYIRSTQFSAFCPIMQYHAETRGEYNRDRTPWNIAERTGAPYVLTIYKAFADLRMNMLPYIFGQAAVSSKTGLPMMRAMCLENPGEEECTGIADQYYFGENLLVAPVIEEGSIDREVYFPSGTWIGFFGDEQYTGKSKAEVKCGIENIPVYVRENSIIPLNLADSLEHCSHVGNGTKGYVNLCFMIYVTGSSAYRFEDEIGNCIDISVNADNGMSISVSGSMVQPVVLIARAAGRDKRAKISNRPLTVCSDEKKLQAGEYCVRGNDLIMKIQGESDIEIY
jgi:alpha-D-xyloside xylohydrolase